MRKFLSVMLGLVVSSGAYAAIGVASTFNPADVGDTYGSYSESEQQPVLADETLSERGGTIADDTNDPLFMLAAQAFLSETDLNYHDEILRFGEQFSYGLNNRLSILGNIHYQIAFDDKVGTGFTAFDLGGRYRMGMAENNSAGMVYDVLFGAKFGGSSHVRTPEYARSTYYAGLRLGKQWRGVTLSGTVKSNWIFDDERGMSYLNFIPEVYFRLDPYWRLGAGFDIVKSTSKYLYKDQEWMQYKLVRRFGFTQYAAQVEYEFEERELLVGAKINILF